MRFKVAHGAAALAALALTTLTVGTALPAQAGAYGVCATERVCLFENEDFNRGSSEHWRDFAGDDSNFSNNFWKDQVGTDTNDNMNDETSSMRSNGCSFTLWQHAGYTGAHNTWNWVPGLEDGKLSNNQIGDNRASGIDVTC
jgi:hypothetical protein